MQITANLVQRPYDCHLSTKALNDIGISVHTVPFRDWWYVAQNYFDRRVAWLTASGLMVGNVRCVLSKSKLLGWIRGGIRVPSSGGKVEKIICKSFY